MTELLIYPSEWNTISKLEFEKSHCLIVAKVQGRIQIWESKLKSHLHIWNPQAKVDSRNASNI